MPDHDVAIIGAGPVGLLLACHLAQRGVDVAVFEEREGADGRSRAIGIHPPGWRALDAAGLGPAVRAEALALDGGEVICGGRVLASLTFDEHRRVLILPQHRTDELLRARLSEVAPHALRLGRAVTGVQDDGAAARLSFETTHEATASFVVAADGVRSGIRGRLGIGWTPRPGTGWYAMADVPDAASGSRAQLYCERDGLVESFPMPGGRRRWVASDPHRALDDAERFANAIHARTGMRLELPDGMRPTAFRAQQHLASRLVDGRTVLVGDAAHETSPIGGQGMNLGWAAAGRLAAAVERSLRTGRADLGSYEKYALASAARAQRRSRFYMAMGRPAHVSVLTVRNAAIRLLGAAPLRGRTADMITMRGTG